MSRIDPQDVVEIFLRRKLRAKRSSWYDKGSLETDRLACCASGAAALDKLGSLDALVKLVEQDSNGGYPSVARLLGVSPDYLTGFTAGFDDRLESAELSDEAKAEYDAGLEDGEQTRILLRASGLAVE